MAASRSSPVCLDDLEPGAEPRCVGRPQPIGVEPDPVADPAGARPSVAEVDRDRLVGLARHDPDRDLHGPARDSAARPRRRFSTPEPLGRAGLTSAALSQVSLVNGLGSSWSQPLLANRPSQTVGSGRKTSSRPARLSAPACGVSEVLDLGVTALTFRAGAGDHARRGPCRQAVEIAREVLAPPVVADDLEARAVGLAQQDGQQLVADLPP